jgi:very-short-patch-repair endonuclease
LAFHSSHRAFEADRRRDADLMSRGMRVIRVTWWQLEKEPLAVIARITRALTLVESPPITGSPTS